MSAAINIPRRSLGNLRILSSQPTAASHSQIPADQRLLGMSVFMILVVIALVLAVVSLIKPGYPLLGVSVILIAIALLISRQGF